LKRRKVLLKIIHVVLILNFVIEILYSGYMVFFIVGGRRWPLFKQATETPVEVILKRRLYAVETWLAIVGLSIYLAITEILPKLIIGKDVWEAITDENNITPDLKGQRDKPNA
jgi:hypothetical protein